MQPERVETDPRQLVDAPVAGIEQPAGGDTTPVLEALSLPGQQPQMRADSVGNAVVEVMAEPVCTQQNGCPDERKLLGALDVTITP